MVLSTSLSPAMQEGPSLLFLISIGETFKLDFSLGEIGGRNVVGGMVEPDMFNYIAWIAFIPLFFGVVEIDFFQCSANRIVGP